MQPRGSTFRLLLHTTAHCCTTVVPPCTSSPRGCFAMQAWSTKGYLSALGVADVASLPPSAAVLQRVVAAQVRTLLYHNAQLLAAGARPASLRTPPSLHPDALYTRLVCERAGGYCFQLNVALATCLADLGFEVRTIVSGIALHFKP
ncbi:hypothetical protein EON67_10105, partial [archaeon]